MDWFGLNVSGPDWHLLQLFHLDADIERIAISLRGFAIAPTPQHVRPEFLRNALLLELIVENVAELMRG